MPLAVDALDEEYETYDESDFESWDESLDEAEFLPLPPLPGLGTVASGIGNLVGGLFGGGRPQRPPVPAVAVPAGQGVSTATLATPQGNATLRLPTEVVTQTQFREVTSRLEDAINRNSGRLNTVDRDLANVTQRVGVVVTSTQRDVTRLRADLKKQQQRQRTALARVRRSISQQQTMNLLMSMMMQQQLSSRLSEHTHTSSGAVADGDDNPMLMMLPMMLMMGDQDGGSGSDNNNMMMMMLPIALMGAFRGR